MHYLITDNPHRWWRHKTFCRKISFFLRCIRPAVLRKCHHGWWDFVPDHQTLPRGMSRDFLLSMATGPPLIIPGQLTTRQTIWAKIWATFSLLFPIEGTTSVKDFWIYNALEAFNIFIVGCFLVEKSLQDTCSRCMPNISYAINGFFSCSSNTFIKIRSAVAQWKYACCKSVQRKHA
jgi:hypothetical protein